ncbi:hypothetical protein BN2476_650069 [Paraburkholderia piptadeniae]|uniref:Uncharacterized protein n=1 Tax=Paraburkholderia piptadeniae TaxID=1701573 RepID=A0A1N7SNB6_9BURK|nr:hypothetical protein BN2476_650069 [Paraburkholderia piptadeniae]
MLEDNRRTRQSGDQFNKARRVECFGRSNAAHWQSRGLNTAPGLGKATIVKTCRWSQSNTAGTSACQRFDRLRDVRVLNVDPSHARQTAGKSFNAFLLILVIRLSNHLREHGMTNTVFIHLIEQHLDRLIPMKRYVSVAINDHANLRPSERRQG